MANIEIIVKKMIDIHVKDVDVYVNKGSLWLIFTEEKKWVIELTKDGILWYNYSFFSKIFRLISMNVVENQHYITRWVEDTLQNGVNHTEMFVSKFHKMVEDTLQNGVKQTHQSILCTSLLPVEDALQNGVKHVNARDNNPIWVEEPLKNGVKHTQRGLYRNGTTVEDTLQNGVKPTRASSAINANRVEDTLQNGVKHTQGSIFDNPTEVKDTIQNGVKETYDDVYHHKGRVDGVIKNGIKEVQPLPAQDGNRDWGNYYHRQKDRTKPHTQYVDDVIENGIKEKL